MAANFYAHIAHTLRTRPTEILLTFPALTPGESGGEYVPPAHYSGEHIELAAAVARWQLFIAGVRPGQRVLLLVPVSFHLITTLLGVLAHGAVVVLPPAGASRKQLLKLARLGQVTAVVVAGRPGFVLQLLAWFYRLKLIGTDMFCDASPDTPPAIVPPDQPALISHTSGSTGQPKQIVRTHAVLSAQHAVLKTVFPPWPGQRDFPLFPNVLLHNLATGAASILPKVPWGNFSEFYPPLIVEQLLDFEVQTLTGNVFYFQKLLPFLQQQVGGFPAVKALGLGGSPVPEWLGHELKPLFPNATIYVIYGSSEAEPIAVRPLNTLLENPALGYAVGRVHPSLELQLLPLGELELPGNIRYPVGEIQVRGPHVASATPGGWLRTGDFGYLAADGQLYLTGRQGNEALCQGVQHYQAEHVLQHLPGVVRVAAQPVAAGFVVYVQGMVSEADVRTALAQHFPAGLCAAVHFRAELPVDSRHHSKIRYADVR
jgi:acyl-CoA synthetase (AMP-forming)/AMP-acid ligase II